jgi:hypothetical protein
MSSIDDLRRDARAYRDEAIRIARRDCRRTLADLDRIAKRMGKPLQTHWSPQADGLSSTDHAQAILTERGPLTLLEIAALAQARGFRTGEPPQRIMHVLRTSMKYHRTRFVRIGEKWALA